MGRGGSGLEGGGPGEGGKVDAGMIDLICVVVGEKR